MIIDADVHISPPPEGGNSIDVDELLRRMDRAGVDKALTWLQPPYMREIDDANAYVHEATKRHPDRILGFGWADPNLGVQKAKDTVNKCIYEYGFYGVKLNGAQNSFYIGQALGLSRGSGCLRADASIQSGQDSEAIPRGTDTRGSHGRSSLPGFE